MISEIAQRTEFKWVRWLPIAFVVALAILVGLAILVFKVDDYVTAGILIGFLLVQFGIKHLLIWTFIVAAFMGIARLITPQLQFDSNNSLAEELRLGLNLTLGNSLIALPVIWGCLSRNYFWYWIIVTVAVCIVVCFVQTLLEQGGSMHSEFLWTINAAQMSISIFAMLAIRFTGNRLNRVVQ